MNQDNLETVTKLINRTPYQIPLSMDKDGQLVLSFVTDDTNKVCMSNSLIRAKQTLSLHSAKVFRAVAMQINPNDKEFFQYFVSDEDLADILDITPKYAKQCRNKIVKELSESGIQFAYPDITGDRQLYGKVNYTSSIFENPLDNGFYITLNPLLDRQFLQLFQNKTPYNSIEYCEYKNFKTVYPLRLYEYIMQQIQTSIIPQNGMYLEVSISDICWALDLECQDMYYFKKKFLEPSIKTINEQTLYNMSATRMKLHSRSYDTVLFFVNHKTHPQEYQPTFLVQ